MISFITSSNSYNGNKRRNFANDMNLELNYRVKDWFMDKDLEQLMSRLIKCNVARLDTVSNEGTGTTEKKNFHLLDFPLIIPDIVNKWGKRKKKHNIRRWGKQEFLSRYGHMDGFEVRNVDGGVYAQFGHTPLKDYRRYNHELRKKEE